MNTPAPDIVICRQHFELVGNQLVRALGPAFDIERARGLIPETCTALLALATAIGVTA